MSKEEKEEDMKQVTFEAVEDIKLALKNAFGEKAKENFETFLKDEKLRKTMSSSEYSKYKERCELDKNYKFNEIRYRKEVLPYKIPNYGRVIRESAPEDKFDILEKLENLGPENMPIELVFKAYDGALSKDSVKEFQDDYPKFMNRLSRVVRGQYNEIDKRNGNWHKYKKSGPPSEVPVQQGFPLERSSKSNSPKKEKPTKFATIDEALVYKILKINDKVTVDDLYDIVFNKDIQKSAEDKMVESKAMFKGGLYEYIEKKKEEIATEEARKRAELLEKERVLTLERLEKEEEERKLDEKNLGFFEKIKRKIFSLF